MVLGYGVRHGIGASKMGEGSGFLSAKYLIGGIKSEKSEE